MMWLLLGHEGPEETQGSREKNKPESRVVRIHDQTFLRLDPEAQEKCGLILAVLEPSALRPEVKAFGQVLDPAPFAAQVSEVATARAALEASRKELERLKVLAQEQNASTRALEAATAQVERDQIAVDAVELKLTAAWGKGLSSQKDLGLLAAALAGREQALVRIDLPAGESLKDLPAATRVAPFSSLDKPIEVEILAAAAAVDPRTQGQGFLTLAKGASLTPGTAVTAWVSLSSAERRGVILPRSAIVRHEGEAFVYLHSGEGLFERKKVELERPTENGWFVEADFKEGSKIVRVGAQQLLSEELKGKGGEDE